eukprot:TRINITY_DN3436_c0_g1_i1.p1 TRINITY_DN3436_c0_g1~~TRINITY_DN3436_c0_g1_i1.p1  ORF type:complete len:352 (+),score=65.86 TRINITY_DN3436_c0_g1_i1:56-1111(+)
MEDSGKRRLSSSEELALAIKKQKTDIEAAPPSSKALYHSTIHPRTSNLESPIMQLTGHLGEIYSLKFSPDGDSIASSSFDKSIFLWKVFGECINYGVLKGHQNAVLEVAWSSDGTSLYSASADKTGAMWDAQTLTRTKKLSGHTSIVNCLSSSRRGPQLVVTASDDASIKLWDMRVRGCQKTFNTRFPSTAVAFNDTTDGFFSGGLDNEIKFWDLRKGEIAYTMADHLDTITGLSVSPDGGYLLSNSMDNTLRLWDIRPYAPPNRCIKVFIGAEHNAERNLLRCSWSADGTKVSAGSSDRFVYVWSTSTTHMLYRLSGHKGSVNEVQFHPTEPIIGSCGSDKSLYLGEIMP